MPRRIDRIYRFPTPCPLCTNLRLLDTGPNQKYDFYAIDGNELPWQPEFYVKCQRCKTEFGVRKLNSTKTAIVG